MVSLFPMASAADDEQTRLMHLIGQAIVYTIDEGSA